MGIKEKNGNVRLKVGAAKEGEIKDQAKAKRK